mgnify:CR=1 FL=1
MAIDVGDGVVKLIGDTTRVDRSIKGIPTKIKQAERESRGAFKGFTGGLNRIKNLAIGVGLVFGAWQVIRILKNAAKATIEFGKEFANVATLINTQTPIGVKQLKILKQQIFALRPELGSATELTRGLYQALSAGAEPAQAVKLVGEAALFAKAGLTDTLTAVDILTTVINAYGLSAEEAAAVSSTLFKTIELGKITGQELAASLGRVIPIAANLNVSLPELNAALATMTKSGLSTAEAVTSLRAILKTLTSPEATKRFEKLGISQAKMRDIVAKDGLNAALTELGKHLKGSAAATTDLFRETEAQVGVFTLLGEGSEEYKRILGVLIKAQQDATATAIAAEKQFATLDAKLETLKVTIEKELIIAFQNITPAIEGVLTSFGLLGSEGKGLRIILEAIAFSILVLSETIIFWKATVELMLLGILKTRLAIAEWVGSNKTLSAIFGVLGTGVGNLHKDIDSLTDAIDADIDEIGKIEAQIKALGKALEAIPKQAPPAAAAIDEVGDAAERAGGKAAALQKILEEGGIETIASLQKEAEEAQKLVTALIAAKVPAFELNQALRKLREANKELAQAQQEVLAGLKSLGERVELSTAPFLKMREAAQKAAEELEKGQLQQSLEELDVLLTRVGLGLEGIDLNLVQIGANIDNMQARVPGFADTFRELGLSFESVTKRMSESIGFAFQAAILGQRGLTEAIREGVAQVLAGIAGQALALSIFYLAKGFAALAGFGFTSAALWFKAAAQMGVVAGVAGVLAKTIAPPRKTATITGTRGEPIGVVTSAAEEETGPLVVERRLQRGGIITRPTLALLGEQAPRIPEAVIPLPRGLGGFGEPQTIEQHFHITVEGLISPDNLSDVIQQISERVRDNDETLQASDSFRMTGKS